MINKINADRIDEVVDLFEDSWSLDSRNQIPSLLKQVGLSDDGTAVTELIRIDIELRYRQGISIRLDDYLDEFGSLLALPAAACEIAFEDYRSREAYGHPVSSSRWCAIPGINNESWYRQLSQRPGEIIPSRRAKDVDETFESALEEIGYRLIHELGRGAFSQVFLATQNDLADRYVVLKIIDKPLSEPQNMAMLQHTNIVPIYSFERILSRSVICMPYAGRVTLADFLKGEQQAASRGGQSLITTVLNRVHGTINEHESSLPQGVARMIASPAADDNAVLRPLQQLRLMGSNELALWLFQRLTAALAHSHARGVLHGDLKPANVLIRNDGEPALLDFNLSQNLDREHIRHAGGTLPYMSPEMLSGLMGQPIKPHPSSDVYSMGVMLYQFVAGRMPFPTPPSSAAIDIEPAITSRRQPIAWPDSQELSPGTRAIVERCLQFDVADRYESAEQLQQDLDRELNNEPLVFARELRTARAKKWVLRHPRVMSGGSVATLLLAVIIPLLVFSVIWRNRSVHLAKIANLNAFTTESSKVLSALIVDPLRNQDETIASAMVPLHQFGIFAGEVTETLGSQLLTDTQQTKYRDTIVRHLTQLAIYEVERLRQANQLQPGNSLTPEQLQRTDLLLRAANSYQEQTTSRSLIFLAAERARLAGDAKQYTLQFASATRMPLDSDHERYLEAVRLMTYRQWPEARELLTSLFARGTIPSALCWTLLGRSQFSEQLYEPAKISYTQSIESAPQSSRLRLLRGLCYFRLNQHKYAEQDFSKAIELEPTLIAAWINRGVSRMALGQFEEAVKDFTSGLQYSPGHIHLLLMRSRAHRRLDNLSAAKRDLDASLASENITVSSLARRATARERLEDYEGALKDLELAEKLDPASILVMKGKAHLLGGPLGRTQEAIDLLAKIEALSPNNEAATIDRAVYHARLGQNDEAKLALQRALVPPNQARTFYQAACVNALLGEQQRQARALGFLSKAIQLGYGADAMTSDPDLDSLRELDGFRAILRTIHYGNRIRAKGQQPEMDSDLLDLDTTP